MTTARIALVGVGRQGAEIGRLLHEDGYLLVGAADPALAGRRLDAALDIDCGDAVVVPDVRTLLSTTTADLAVVTAPVSADALKDLVIELLDAGTNVLTLHAEVFDPPEEWAREVDDRAKAAGVSYLATGVQDVWWVHLPAVAAASLRNLRGVRTDDVLDAGLLWPGFGDMVGIGRPAADFERLRREVLAVKPPVLAGGLRALARRLGLTPEGQRHDVEPVIATRTLHWHSADRDVPAGALSGYVESTEVTTREGIVLGGRIRASLLEPGEVGRNSIELLGDPVLRIEMAPFPGVAVTSVIPAARVPDVLAAPPGLQTAATLPPARHHAAHPTHPTHRSKESTS